MTLTNLCTPSSTGSSSSIWVMVDDTGNNFLQAGYIRDGGTTQSYMFVEYAYQSTFNIYKYVDYNSGLPGSNYWYKVGLDQASGLWYLGWSSDNVNWVNYQTIANSNFNWQGSFSGTYPTRTSYRTEVHNGNDAIMGSSTNPVIFQGMQLKNTSGTWIAESNLTDQQDSAISSHANMSTISTTSFKVWDSAN